MVAEANSRSNAASQGGASRGAADHPAIANTGSKLGTLPAVALAAGRAWLAHRASSNGAALALYTLLSLGPMLILVLAIAGVFADATALQSALLAEVKAMVGQQG